MNPFHIAQRQLAMAAVFHAVHSTAQRFGIDNRIAAYVVAVARVAEACKLRGWV